MASKELREIKLCALPGGGSAAWAPATEGFHAGDHVMLTSKSKGARPGTLGASLGTIVSPVGLGAVDLFAFRADK